MDSRRWLPILLILLAVWLPFGQTIYSERIGDDRVLIPSRLDIPAASQLWTENYWGPYDASGLYRPLALTALYAQRAAFGLQTRPYRIVNLSLYSLACLLCFLFLRTLFSPSASTLATLLFALHPAHVEVVITAYGQLEMYVAIFVFLALIAHARSVRTNTLAPALLAAAAFLAALLCKESAVAFPALAILTRGLWLTPELPGWRRWVSHRDALYLAALAIFAAAKIAIIGTISVPAQAATMAQFSLYRRLYTVFTHGLGNYLRLTVFPYTQSMVYDVFPSPFGDAKWLLIALVILALSARRLGLRPVLYATLWFFATWFIFSNLIVTTGVFVAERCLFLPVLAVCILFGLLTERNPVLAILLLLPAVQSAITADAWRTEESSLRASVEAFPDSPIARSTLALTILLDPPVTADRQQEAESLLNAVLAKYPGVPEAHRGLGLLARLRGDEPAAVNHLKRALALRPRDLMIQRDLVR